MAQEVIASPSDTEEHYEFIPNVESSQSTETTVPSTTCFVRAGSLRRASFRRGPRPQEMKVNIIESEEEAHSLNEEVFDLTDKIANLEEKVAQMSHHKKSNDGRLTRVQNENRQLLAKLDTVEEKLRDTELQAQERRKNDERRLKEAVAKCHKEMQSMAESHQEKIDSLEKELTKTTEEFKKIQVMLERNRIEKVTLEEELMKKSNMIVPLERSIEELTETNKKLQDELFANEKLISVLNEEINELRIFSQRHNSIDLSTNTSQIELQRVIESLRGENRQLQETNEDLQAQLLSCCINEGRSLVSIQDGKVMTACLADELITLTEEQLRRALKEQQEDNFRLKKYIDDILLNIVNNYPDLLEVGRSKVTN